MTCLPTSGRKLNFQILLGFEENRYNVSGQLAFFVKCTISPEVQDSLVWYFFPFLPSDKSVLESFVSENQCSSRRLKTSYLPIFYSYNFMITIQNIPVVLAY